MQVAEDFLQVLPFRTSDLESDLTEPESPALQQQNLVERYVMVEDDQAALLDLA